MDLKDEYEYWKYSLQRPENRPPLIKIKSRVIWAVVNNQVDILSSLLVSPEWYKVRDKLGYTLLQIAICQNCQVVFHYLLSLPGYPVEEVNEHGLTAACVAFGVCYLYDMHFVLFAEYFAFELLQRNVMLDTIYNFGDTPLHCALKRHFFRVAKHFIEIGTDVNVRNKKGETPLQLAFNFPTSRDRVELVCALLVQGAHCTAPLFQKYILCCPPTLQEILFLYTFDSLSDCSVKFDLVLQLAKGESWIFDEILKSPISIKVDKMKTLQYFSFLCSIKTDYLRKIMEKFGFPLDEIVLKAKKVRQVKRFDCLYLENLNLLLNSDFKDFTTDIVNYIRLDGLCRFFVPRNFTQEKITELYCLLLSYGFSIKEVDLLRVYESYGYCHLFKILLHMDYEVEFEYFEIFEYWPMMAKIIYDTSVDLKECLKFVIEHDHSDHEKIKYVGELVHYFADQRPNHFVKRDSAHFPSLVELARNEFRDYFIKTFDIRTSQKFFTLLKCLPINNVFKKILSFERRLY